MRRRVSAGAPTVLDFFSAGEMEAHPPPRGRCTFWHIRIFFPIGERLRKAESRSKVQQAAAEAPDYC